MQLARILASVHPIVWLRHVVQTVPNIIAQNALTTHYVKNLTNAPYKTVHHKVALFTTVPTVRTQAHAPRAAITYPAELIAHNRFVLLVLPSHNASQPRLAHNTTSQQMVSYSGLVQLHQHAQTTTFARTQVH